MSFTSIIKKRKWYRKNTLGDFRNGKPDGKGIEYYNNGDRYEGDFRNGKKEGKGIYYYNNGDRIIGDYYNGKPIGKHEQITRYGIVQEIFY